MIYERFPIILMFLCHHAFLSIIKAKKILHLIFLHIIHYFDFGQHILDSKNNLKLSFLEILNFLKKSGIFGTFW